MIRERFAVEISHDGVSWHRPSERYGSAQLAGDVAFEATVKNNVWARVVKIMEVEAVLGGYKHGETAAWFGDDNTSINERWVVSSSAAGVDRPREFIDEHEARTFVAEARKVPSYIRPNTFRKAQLHRVVTIVQEN